MKNFEITEIMNGESRMNPGLSVTWGFATTEDGRVYYAEVPVIGHWMVDEWIDDEDAEVDALTKEFERVVQEEEAENESDFDD